MRHIPAVFILSALSAPLSAQRAVANGDVNVRTGQSMSSTILDHLTAGDTVTLLSQTQTKGYYHIEEASGTKGWAYSRYLDVIGGAPVVSPTPVPTPTPTPAPSTTTASTVSSSWDKPAPQSSTFQRPGFPDCGPTGDGGDSPTNLRKNRTDEPSSYHRVTFDAILGLPYPKNEKPERSGWPPSDLAKISPVEGAAVSVTAFIAKQRGIIVEDSQNGSSGESTNCHAVDSLGVDWHMTIVKQKDDPKSAGIVVETTPRVRLNGHPWTPAMLATALADRDSVRVSGWLMYDPEHYTQTSNYDPAHPYATTPKVRATLWEIHPVTKIEVFDPATGTWHAIL